MPRSSKGDEESKDTGKKTTKVLADEAEVKLARLGELASVADYWRIQTSSLLFTNFSRMDEAVRSVAGDYRKVLDSWNGLLDKVREVKANPKVSKALDSLAKVSSSRNPWRLLSLSMGFILIGVLLVGMYILPGDYLPVVIVVFIVLFALNIYGTFKIRKMTKRNIEAIQKDGGKMISELSEICKDVAQTVINTLIYELPKQGKGSDTYTLKLLSNDYSNTKLRIQEKVKKGRRTGDLYSIVWK